MAIKELKALESLVDLTRFYLIQTYKGEELESKLQEMYDYVDIVKGKLL